MNSHKLLKSYYVEAVNFGQIGAGRVVPFVPRSERKWIPLPKNARAFDKFAEYEVSGDSLEGIGIYDGNLLTCRTNFELSEVKPNKVCVIYLRVTGEQIAKMIKLNHDGTLTLFGANPRFEPRTYFIDEIEILALVEEVRRKV